MRKKRCKVLFILRWPKSISEKCLLLPAATNRALKREAFSAMRPRAVGATRVTVQWGSLRCPGDTMSLHKKPSFHSNKVNKGSLCAAPERSWGGTQNTQLYPPAQPSKGPCHTPETRLPLSHNALLKPCSLPPWAYTEINQHSSRHGKTSSAQSFVRSPLRSDNFSVKVTVHWNHSAETLVWMKFQGKSKEFHQGPTWRTTSLDARCWKCTNFEQNVPQTSPPRVSGLRQTQKRSFGFSTPLDALPRQVLSARTSRLPSVTLQNEPARGSTPENQDISWHLITLPWQALSWHCSRRNTHETKNQPWELPSRAALFVTVNSQLQEESSKDTAGIPTWRPQKTQHPCLEHTDTPQDWHQCTLESEQQSHFTA